MSFAFAMTLAAMFGLAALGTPISLSMIVAAVAYLAIKGQDLGLACKADQPRHRSEGLLAVQERPGRHAREDGRRVEEALAR